MNTAKEKLKNRGGRFTSIRTRNYRGVEKSYCGRISKVTDSSVVFFDMHAQVMRTIPLKNVV